MTVCLLTVVRNIVTVRDRGGRLVFHPDDIRLFTDLLLELYDLSASSDYIRDMRINKKLTTDEIGNAVGMGK